MKRILFITILTFSVLHLSAQSDKYMKAMEANIAAVDTTGSSAGFAALSNTFGRIADAEKTQWLPYYYAALSQVMSGLMAGTPGVSADASVTDPMADKAEALINKAEELEKENSEIYVVKKMIATLRMMADPMNRWQTYGPVAAEALSKAKQLNPQNPRVYLLEGQDKFFTPAEFGGSKEEAKALFEQSMKQFESQKPQSTIHPQWGLRQVKYFHAQCK